MLKDLLHQKKLLLMNRIASVDSETESEAMSMGASDTGSIITNPAFVKPRGLFNSFRRVMSDADMTKEVNTKHYGQI